MTHTDLPYPLRFLNTVGRLTPARRIDRFRLDKPTVMQEASASTGLSDFGDPGFEAGLGALLTSIGEDVEPHLVGQIALRTAIVDALANRLLLTEEQRLRPWVFEQPLRPPIIVTGLHRSGTTHLHRLLAQDPSHHAPPYWQLVSPIVAPGARDTRRRQAQRSLAVRTRMMPDLSRMHTIDADAPEECLYVLASTFESVFFWSMAPLTSYLDWYLRQDRTRKYVEYRLWLQVLQQQTPDQRLVLKAPEHLGAVDALLRAVPEATVVHIHRDPVTAYASYVSMAKTTQGLAVPELDARTVAHASLELFATELQRNSDARSTLSAPVFDVQYDDLVADPVGTVTALYAAMERPMSAPVVTALRAYDRAHPIRRHGVHQYSLEDAQIDADLVQHRLAS